MTGRRPANLSAWRKRQASGQGVSATANTARALRKAERKLCNSMAHVARPRPADYERWRAMEARIAALKAELARLRAGGEPQRFPPKAPRKPLKTLAPVTSPIKAKFANTAKPNSGGSDATS